MEQFEQFLADEAIRQEFYERLKAFSRCLHISLSSDKLLRRVRRGEDRRHEAGLEAVLRTAALGPAALPGDRRRQGVRAEDPEAARRPCRCHAGRDDHRDGQHQRPGRAEGRGGGNGRLRGVKGGPDRQRDAADHHRKDGRGPDLLPQFSELLEETIRDYRAKRISERDYLKNVVDLASKVARKDRGREVPDAIKGNDDGQAFFGILEGVARDRVTANRSRRMRLPTLRSRSSTSSRRHHIVDVWSNDIAQNKMRNAIDDYFFDVLRDERGIELPVEVMDDLELKIMDLARARFPG